MKAQKFNQVQLTTAQFERPQDDAAFEIQSRAVCAHFARCARERGAELPGASRIVGHFRAAPARAGVEFRDGAAVVTQLDDVRGVMALPASERKRAFLHLILRTLEALSEGPPPQAFLDAAADVRAADFVNAWSWLHGAPRSPDHRRRATVTVAHELHGFDIRLAVDDARGNLSLETMLARGLAPDEQALQAVLGELRWDGPDRIVVQPRPAGAAAIVVDLPPLRD